MMVNSHILRLVDEVILGSDEDYLERVLQMLIQSLKVKGYLTLYLK